jgi:DNA polymerase III sliding clamp (beta) subunit (PCNA family)
MSGVAFRGKKMYSTDTQRVSIYTNDTDSGEEGFIIPYEAIVDLLKYGKEATDISVTNSWIHFKAPNDTVISIRKLIGEYPYDKIEEVFSEHSIKDKKEKPLVFPEGIDKSLDRVEILSSADTDLGTMPLVTMMKEGKFLIIRGEKDVGRIEEKIPWESSAMPDGTEIKISPEFLRKTLKITREFWISPTRNSIIFNAPDFKHLMVVKVG